MFYSRIIIVCLSKRATPLKTSTRRCRSFVCYDLTQSAFFSFPLPFPFTECSEVEAEEGCGPAVRYPALSNAHRVKSENTNTTRKGKRSTCRLTCSAGKPFGTTLKYLFFQRAAALCLLCQVALLAQLSNPLDEIGRIDTVGGALVRHCGGAAAAAAANATMNGEESGASPRMGAGIRCAGYIQDWRRGVT